MNKYSNTSIDRLMGCDARLQEIFQKVLPIMNHTILEGFRDKEAQDFAFDTGKSKVRWPDGKHNHNPSLAVDAAPWPIDWQDVARFTFFAGLVVATGHSIGVKIRWGGCWKMDYSKIIKGQGFVDLPHFEIWVI